MLCHEQKPFKDSNKIALISKDHPAEMGELFDMDAAELQADVRVCLRCHFENIHSSDILKQGVAE
jgi:hypothetical protein